METQPTPPTTPTQHHLPAVGEALSGVSQTPTPVPPLKGAGVWAASPGKNCKKSLDKDNIYTSTPPYVTGNVVPGGLESNTGGLESDTGGLESESTGAGAIYV